MMLTEDQAKEKWCPFARVMLAADGIKAIRATYNRLRFGEQIEHSPIECRCIASQCMAWRAAPQRGVEHTHRWKKEGGAPEGEGWTLLYPEAKAELQTWERQLADLPIGYCGLAGQVTP